jgi:hypothetical protein
VTHHSIFSTENSLRLPLLLPRLFAPDVKPPEKPREKSGLKSLFSMKADVDYASLFESKAPAAQPSAAAGAFGGAAAPSTAKGGVASASCAAADARDALVQRGEKLSQLSDRCCDLYNNSSHSDDDDDEEDDDDDDDDDDDENYYCDIIILSVHQLIFLQCWWPRH